MKKVFKSIMLFAVAAMTFTACNKENDIQDVVKNGETTTIRFSAAVNDAETKATLTTEDEKSFKAAWEEGDKMEITVTSGSSAQLFPATWNGNFFEFGVPTEWAETVSTWNYEAYYPSKVIPFGSNRIQNGSQYASQYDAMQCEMATFENAKCGLDSEGGHIVLPMTRVSSILYFHLTSDLEETLASATLKVGEGSIAAENVAYDYTKNSLAVKDCTGSNTITLTFAEGTAPSAKDFCLWYNVIPGKTTGMTLTITTTSGKTATLSNPSGKTYLAGKLNKVVKNGLTWVNPQPAEKYYVKVTTLTQIVEDAQYVIGATYDSGDGNVFYAIPAKPTLSSGKISGEEVTVSANGVAESDAEGYVWTLSKSGDYYTLSDGSGYLYHSNGGNSGTSLGYGKEAKYLWAITEESSPFKFAGVNDSVVKNRGLLFSAENNNVFGGYALSNFGEAKYAGIELYVLEDDRQDSGMSWSTESATASWNTGNVAGDFTAPSFNTGNATGVTFETNNADVATVSSTGAIAITGPGEAIIKAIFAGDATYKPATVTCTITVSDNRDQVATPTITPDASNTVATGTEVTITCSMEGATIYYTLDGTAPTSESNKYSSAIVLDESKTVKAIAVKEGYKDSDVAVANYVVGVVNTSTEANPYSISDVISVIDELGNGTLDGVYVKGIVTKITTSYNATYKNVSFDVTEDGDSENTTKFRIYRAPAESEDTFVVGDAVELKGVIKKYNTTYEMDGSEAAIEVIAQLHKPAFTPDGGTFTESQSVTIVAEDGASILYSVDGSAPATTYSAALNLTETTTVKAIATKGILTTGIAEATFTKSSGDNYIFVPNQTFTFSSLYSANTVLDGTTISGTNCSMVFNKRDGGTATQYYTNGQAVRWYGGGSLAITAPAGYKITSIKITYSQTANSISVNEGSYSLSNSVGTWSGEVSNGSSVIFTQSGTTGQCRITSIEIN